MNIFDSLRIALTALRANTLRSILTTLGIIIGVGSVIVMVAVGSGARSEVDRQIASLGSNMLVVYPGASRVGGRSAGAGSRLPLSERDMQALREKTSRVVAISGCFRQRPGGARQCQLVDRLHRHPRSVQCRPRLAGRERPRVHAERHANRSACRDPRPDRRREAVRHDRSHRPDHSRQECAVPGGRRPGGEGPEQLRPRPG